jgi:hypothetical protein
MRLWMILFSSVKVVAIKLYNMANLHLHTAKRTRNDEYRTLYRDICREMPHYRKALSGKRVYCNCDGRDSNFRNYLLLNFKSLNLKRLYCTGIDGEYMEYDGIRCKSGKVDGDFKSEFCRELAGKVDVIITNPPFSEFKEFVPLLDGKDFLIIGPKTAISYKVLFPLIQSGACKLGHTIPNVFYDDNGSKAALPGLCRWFTSLPVIGKLPKPIKHVPLDRYERFDLYPALNIDRIENLPKDYYGLIGVPISFIDYIDYDAYEIVDHIARYAVLDHSYDVKGHQLTEVNGKPKYARLIIKRKIRNNN